MEIINWIFDTPIIAIAVLTLLNITITQYIIIRHKKIDQDNFTQKLKIDQDNFTQKINHEYKNIFEQKLHNEKIKAYEIVIVNILTMMTHEYIHAAKMDSTRHKQLNQEALQKLGTWAPQFIIEHFQSMLNSPQNVVINFDKLVVLLRNDLGNKTDENFSLLNAFYDPLK